MAEATEPAIKINIRNQKDGFIFMPANLYKKRRS